MRDMPRLLYVAGYSRSGSTMLDMLLGSHRDVFSAGELTFLLDDAETPSRHCTCGVRYADCPVYGPWLASPAGRVATSARHRLRGVDRRGMESPADPFHGDAWRSLFRHLRQETGAKLIVDSSKSARDAALRPRALAKIEGLDIRVLHLSRDPRAVVRSYCENGRNWVQEGHRKPRPFDTFRPILGWRRANREARALAGALGAGRVMSLRYEDLVANPALALSRIGAFLSMDFTPVADGIRDGRAFEAQHSVGGNRARLVPQRFIAGHVPRARLSFLHEAAFRLTAQREARRLGYA